MRIVASWLFLPQTNFFLGKELVSWPKPIFFLGKVGISLQDQLVPSKECAFHLLSVIILLGFESA